MNYDGLRPLIAIAFDEQNEVVGEGGVFPAVEGAFSEALAAAKAMLLESERKAVRSEVRYFDWGTRTFSYTDKPLAVITLDDVAITERRIPTGRIYPGTEKIINDNGGEVGPQETILRNIQEERPYLNTGATKVIFKSGKHIYYNEIGIWNDVSRFEE